MSGCLWYLPEMETVSTFLSQKPCGPLYHYTDARGLLGIFERKEIWASDALHLNDAKERSHAGEVLVDQLGARVSDGTISVAERDALLGALRYHQTVDPLGVSSDYVASLSENGDQLSQWRAYCPQGNGFSLGLSTSDLGYVIGQTRFRLVKCVYDPEQQRALIRAMMKYFLPRGLGWRESSPRARIEVEWCAAIMLAIKDPSFAEEQEWRLVGSVLSTRDHRRSFRQGRFGIVPYIPLPLCPPNQKPSYSHVYVGPNAEPGIARKAVIGMLQDWGRVVVGEPQAHDKVLGSRVPFRYASA